MSSESLKSLIVTDPSLLDEGIDVSGLRTQTDTNPRLLASIADFPGISYDPTSFDYLSDLNELFAYGLPAIDTPAAAVPPATGGGADSGGGEQILPFIDVDGPKNTEADQRLLDAGIGVQGALGDPVVAPGEIPYTQDEFDEFNREPVTPVSPTTQPIDPTGMLPQTSLPYMVEGALGVDSREKEDFVTEADLIDNTSLLQRLGLPADFDLKRAAVEAGINLVAGIPVSLIARGLGAVLPDRDPRQTALDELYDVKDGTIQSGLMKGYNPVSGNPLDPTYGLQEAYQDRIDTIENTLQNKYNMTAEDIAAVKAGTYTNEEDIETDLLQRLVDLENAKAAEKARLDLFSGDVDERDQMLDDLAPTSLKSQVEAGIQAAEDDKGSEMLDTSTGVNPFDTDDFDEGMDFTTTPATTPNIIEDTGIDNIKKNIDDATIREIANIADRQPETIEQKKNELADIYDRQVDRGEREPDQTITSKTNKAKAAIGMPQMLGDVGSGDSGSDSPGGKIVCTMMNEFYGFGSFRNKIWLRHSKGLAPEYQKGYHKIFLPLVKLSKTNKLLKKTLEHIAVHRTIAIRQEARGKVHLLGRVYRKILEPICYIVGKYAKR